MVGTQQDARRLPQSCRDDEKACGEDEHVPLHFFRLPIELRYRIYDLVFDKGLVLRPHESDDEVKPWTRLVDEARFSVNKFMRTEAMSWFFANNGFVLNYDQTGMGGVVLSFFSKNSHGQRCWLLNNLRRLRIEIALYYGSQLQDVENAIIEICDVLANCTRVSPFIIRTSLGWMWLWMNFWKILFFEENWQCLVHPSVRYGRPTKALIPLYHWDREAERASRPSDDGKGLIEP